MDIRELRYFAAVFRERNLTAAARRCFISQPSISAAITNLEAELGTTLFIRHKKGVAPTASISKNIIRADEYFIPLWVERYVAALPPSHPLTLKEKLRTSDLAGVAMIDRCHCEQSEFFGRAASPSRQPAAIAESEDWTMALVAAGVGIAIVPEGVARANPDVAVREIDVDVKRQVGLAYSAARPPSEVLQSFIARLQNARPTAARAKSGGNARR